MTVTENSTIDWNPVSLQELANKASTIGITNVTTPAQARIWVDTHCKLSDCFSGTRDMPCDNNGVRLGFFNWVNFFISAIVIAGIYFVFSKK
jgi:hypothetical protein